MSAVSVSSLVVEYGGKRVVQSLDLDIEEGAFVTLLGPSGCGKTTTLRCIAGLERPVSGSIRYGDRVVFDSESNVFVPPEKRKPGLVFQNYGLWPHLTAGGNVAFPLRMQKVKQPERNARVTELLDLVGLGHRIDDMAGGLSGGQQQRVALARALANGSSLILYDEPLSNLDAQLRTTTRGQIKALHDKLGTTSIFVTHDQEEALALSDVVVVMDEGRIAQIGSPQDVYERPVNEYVARFVGFDNVLTARVVALNATSATVLADSGDLTLVTRLGEGAADRLCVGDPVTVAWRGLSSRIGDSGADTEGNNFRGTITGLEFAGERTTYEVEVRGTAIRVSVANSLSQRNFTRRAGDEMFINIPEEEVMCLPLG